MKPFASSVSHLLMLKVSAEESGLWCCSLVLGPFYMVTQVKYNFVV